MSAEDRQAFRIVVQHVHETPTGDSYYSLLVYREGKTWKASGMSLDDLLGRLRSAGLMLDQMPFAPHELDETSVVFAGLVDLSRKQLVALDLKDIQ